jgi:hypothetical protein
MIGSMATWRSLKDRLENNSLMELGFVLLEIVLISLRSGYARHDFRGA